MNFPESGASGSAHQAGNSPAGIRARVIGIVQGRELDAQATVALEQNSIVLHWDNASPWQIDLDGLDGIMPRANQLTLYLSSGDVLELTENEALRQLGANVLDRACAVPELTRGLRALGSLRNTPGPAHDRWFAPLLAARRSVAGITDAERQVALIDAAHIAQHLRRVMSEIAKEISPAHAAMQRAIEAALNEESEATFVALERLAFAADVLRSSPLDTRLVDWRRWMQALREVFVAADQSWPRCAIVIEQGV